MDSLLAFNSAKNVIEVNYDQMKHFEFIRRIYEFDFGDNETGTGITIINVESPFLIFVINQNEVNYEYWSFNNTNIVELIVLEFLKGEYVYQTIKNSGELCSLVWNDSRLHKYNLGSSIHDSEKKEGFKFITAQT